MPEKPIKLETREEKQAYIDACLEEEDKRIKKTRKPLPEPQKPQKRPFVRRIRFIEDTQESNKFNRKGRIQKQ